MHFNEMRTARQFTILAVCVGESQRSFIFSVNVVMSGGKFIFVCGRYLDVFLSIPCHRPASVTKNCPFPVLKKNTDICGNITFLSSGLITVLKTCTYSCKDPVAKFTCIQINYLLNNTHSINLFNDVFGTPNVFEAAYTLI